MSDEYDKLKQALQSLSIEDLERKVMRRHTRICEIDAEIGRLNKEKQKLHEEKSYFSSVLNLRKHSPMLEYPDIKKDDRLKDMKILQACHVVLIEEDRPLHIDEIVARLKAGGMTFRADDPASSVEATVKKNAAEEDGVIVRVSPRTYESRKEV